MQTHQVLPRFEVMSRSERNKRLQKTTKYRGGVELVPEGLDPYQRTYICTHGWPPRKNKTGVLGKRPRQHIRYTECPFRFFVQWREKEGQWQLQVRGGQFVHNHSVSVDTYSTYPCARGITDIRVEARVEGMLEAGAKRSKIYDYLLEHKQNVIQSDVDNLVRTHWPAVSSVNDDDATAAEIANFMAEDPQNVAIVAATVKGEAGVISLASAHMREMYERFPEMLLVDSSHKTNRHNYQLVTMMVMNAFGEGSPVQHSHCEANGDWHMERAIAHFKRMHPEKTKLLRVIVVDKNLNEIKVLQIAFPEARVLICHFHVIKWLKETRGKPEYGKISSEDAGRVDAVIHGMVYAEDAHVYNTHHEAFERLCKRLGVIDFFNYFERNWHNSQEMWVMYHRNKLPHFRNHTNNRLEKFFGKMKGCLDGSSSMAACVKVLVKASRRTFKDYQHLRSRVGCNVNANYDEKMATVLRYTSHYVTRAIEPQYSIGLSEADRYSFKVDQEDKSIIHDQSDGSIYQLSIDDWRCDWDFAKSMLLPCRHVIAYRKHASVPGALIPLTRVDERWTVPCVDLKEVHQFEYTDFESNPGKRACQRTPQERYREAVRATGLISSELAEISDDDDRMLDYVLKQWHNVRNNNYDGDSSPSNSHTKTKSPQKRATAAARVNCERTATIKDSASEGEKSCSGFSSVLSQHTASADSESASPVRIKLNKKAKKSGRPRKVRRKDKIDDRASRGWYKTVSAARIAAKADTLQGLLLALEKERPSLSEVQSRLSGIVVKTPNSEYKKSKFKKMENPVLNMDAFYLLPPELLQSCIKVLPVSNSPRNAIVVDADDESAESGETVEVVVINNYGTYSRTQIETFKRVENLKTNVVLGVALNKWLLDDVLPAMPVHQHDLVRQAADMSISTYPYSRIPGLESVPEYNYAMFYRATPPAWLSDACIRALCERLQVDFPSAFFGGMQSASPRPLRVPSKTRSKKRFSVGDHTVQAVRTAISHDNNACVMIPVNFDNAHGCSLIVLADHKRVCYYDPLGLKSYLMALKEIADSLLLRALQGKEFSVLALNNPIQFDQFSCGVFVSWNFISHVVPDAMGDITVASLTRRRFELFIYILTGCRDIFEQGKVTRMLPTCRPQSYQAECKAT